jgi:hypothetical protein
MALNWPSKGPNELLDYQINWSQALGTDTITLSTWTISDPALTNDHDSYAAQSTTIWLAAGTLNQTYAVTNAITTAAGRIFDQTVNIKIAAK